MTKAERRKRAREKKRSIQRGGDATAVVAEAPADSAPAVAPVSVAAAPVATVESQYITGPIAPRLRPQPAPAQPAPAATVAAAAGSFLSAAAPVTAETEDDEDEDGPDEDGEEGEESDDDDDDEPMDEEDALFNLACASVEQGENLSWNELVTWLLAAEVEDPRLALLATLLVTDEDTTEVPKLTGQRVLDALEHIDFADMVAEAKETVANAPPEEGETDEERQLVRTSARALAEVAKVELASTKKGGDKPLKASQLRGQQAGKAAR
jgi:hypothetical protein